MKLWEYLVKNFGFKTEAESQIHCNMCLVSVNGITCRYYDTVIFEGDEVSVVRKITKTVKLFDEEMPKLDITPERLDEDKLKHNSPESCGGLSDKNKYS